MTLRVHVSEPRFESVFASFVTAKREVPPDVGQTVAEIMASVRAQGDEALRDYSRRFDRWPGNLQDLAIDAAEIADARASCATATLDALTFAAKRIEAFHERQRPENSWYRDDAGVELGSAWRPIDAVGLYVPGGKAAYPSSVLMNAIPALVAGVRRIVMVVPTPDGTIDPTVLAAADLVGIREIYRIGGAQAIAALAFGTETISPVDKIVGPGNAYVAEAKRQVYGIVGIDMIAGPSEILVLADAANRADWIAADLLSQAEHDGLAQAILITDDSDFADKVEAAVAATLAKLGRAEIAAASWRDHGAIFVVEKIHDAISLIDRIAPEHLELAVDDPHLLADEVHNAGAIFLGRHTPEAIGDYVAGTNHVLPTARSARFSSGLSVLDFMKRTSLVKCDPGSLAKIGPAAMTLAESEGLGAHALSVSIRLDRA